jgi:dTMP kinase
MPRPLFISLDGLDGTGKSTQCQLLAEWLRKQGQEVVECTDPGGTKIGDAIREILLGQREESRQGASMSVASEALLFMASRAQLTAEVIRPALEAGRTVVADRYLLANVVYQGHAGGLDPDQLWEIGQLATGGLMPDLTFVLDLPAEVALSRRTGPADRVESRDLAYHTRVREGFLAEARRHPDIIQVVDATPPIQKIHERIRHVLAAHSRP